MLIAGRLADPMELHPSVRLMQGRRWRWQESTREAARSQRSWAKPGRRRPSHS